MNQQQVILPLHQIGGDLGSRQSGQMQQVLPILTGGLGTIGMLDDGPIDFEFLGLVPQGVEEHLVERDPAQFEAAKQFRLRIAASGWAAR